MNENALQPIPEAVPAKFSQQFMGTTPQIVQLLPRDVPLDQFQAGLWMEFTTTPLLQKCTPMSLIKATVKAAMKGHVPGRDCFFIPFKNKEVLEAAMVEYYQGIVRALDRTGRVEWAKAEPVYARDHFLCDELAERYEFQRHIDGERGKLRCYFSAVKLKGAEKPLVRVCTVEEVEKVRSKAPGREQDPWLKWPEEMGKKTALKKHAKYLQLVPDEEEPIPAVNHSALLFGGDEAEQSRLRSIRPSVAAILTAPEPEDVTLPTQPSVPPLPEGMPVAKLAPGIPDMGSPNADTGEPGDDEAIPFGPPWEHKEEKLSSVPAQQGEARVAEGQGPGEYSDKKTKALQLTATSVVIAVAKKFTISESKVWAALEEKRCLVETIRTPLELQQFVEVVKNCEGNLTAVQSELGAISEEEVIDAAVETQYTSV